MSSCVFGSHLVLKLVHSHSGIPRVSAGQPKTQLDIQMHHPDVIRTAPKGFPETKTEKTEYRSANEQVSRQDGNRKHN